MLIQLEPGSFGVDPARHTPVLVLKESGGQRTIGVPLGAVEANAIAMHAMGAGVEKPLAIDLARQVMAALGGTLERVLLMCGAEKGSFTAQLQIRAPRGIVLMPASPSHGIVLAMRCGAPVFAYENVFDAVETSEAVTPSQKLKSSIAAMDTVEFGRYHLE
jgi:bifunctional DNase/RNase